MYDLDMKEIPFPEGLVPLDIFISSISKNRTSGSIEGSHRKINYGSTSGDRDVELTMLLRSYDTQDYRLLRDEVYEMFNRHDTFYIVEEYQRGKRLLVSVDDKYIPERFPGDQKHAAATINCSTAELPFMESIGTSADIDNPELIPIVPGLWVQGYWALDTGKGTSNSQTNIRTNIDIKIPLSPGKDYRLTSFGDYEARLNMYSDEEYLGYVHSGKNDSKDFKVLEGATYGRISVRQYKGNEEMTPSMIGSDINISLKRSGVGILFEDNLWGFGMGLIYDDDSLEYTHIGTSFRIFNPGIDIHPFEQFLKIEISDVRGSDIFLQLQNRTTGDFLRITEPVGPDQVIKIDGAVITSNNLNYLRKTNRKFISLKHGWNNFRLTGAVSAKVGFDFRFYY